MLAASLFRTLISCVFLLLLPVITLVSATTFDGTKQRHCILTDRLEFLNIFCHEKKKKKKKRLASNCNSDRLP